MTSTASFRAAIEPLLPRDVRRVGAFRYRAPQDAALRALMLEVARGDWVRVHRDAFLTLDPELSWFHHIAWCCERCDDWFVRAFDSAMQSHAFFNDMRLFRPPCGITGHHVRATASSSCARGFDPSPRQRLAIYGESPEERRWRDLRNSWRFGPWLARQKEFHGLAVALDAREALEAMSYEEALQHFLFDEDDDAGECDGFLIDDLDEAAAAWLHAEGEGEVASACTDPDRSVHHCHVELVPLKPPASGGVYFVVSAAPTPSWRVKIGWAKSSIAKRIRDLATSHPWALHLLAFLPRATLADEAALHRRFAPFRARDAAGAEWFDLRDDLLDFVRAARMGRPA